MLKLMGYCCGIMAACLGSVALSTNVSAAVRPSIDNTHNVVYLTFDDGPDPTYTPKILDVLHREHVQATFFVLGSRAEQYPQIVRRMYREGNEIGNHGYYHTFIVHKSKQWVQSDITKTDQVIQTLCGETPKFFRPPGGILSKGDLGLVLGTGHSIAMWTIDTNDWKGIPPQLIVSSVVKHLTPNSIILMHDGVSTSHTVQALPMIIHQLRARGYSFKILPKKFKGSSIGGATDSKNYRFRTHSTTRTVPLDSSAEKRETELNSQQEMLQPIYKPIATRYQLPVALLEAVDRYGELNKDTLDTAISPTFGFMLNEALWSGPSNPCHPDFDPRTLRAFGGMGLDGNGDGLALPFDAWDRIASIGAWLAMGGISGFGNVIKDPNAIVEVTAFENIYEQYGLNPKGKSFPLDKHFPYTMENSYGEGRNFGGNRRHEGEDIFAAIGTPVVSCAYGYIENKGWNRLGGWRLGIRSTEGMYYYYAHLLRYAHGIEQGDTVHPGEVIGYVGDTGYGTPGTRGKFPPHLHFGVYLQKERHREAVNPLPYLMKWNQSPQKISYPKLQ